MSLTIQKSPEDYSPAYNDMTYLISSTNTAQPNFYIKGYVDYFLDGTGYTNIIECNLYPLPGKNYAKFDPSRILRSYVTHDLAILIGATTSGQRSSLGEHYQLRFREYYGSPPSAQGSEISTSSDPKYVFNASFETREYSRYDENDYVINGTQLARFLTPVDEVWVKDTDTFLLSVMSKTTGSTALYTKLRVEKFDYSNVSLGTSDISMQSPESEIRNRFQSVRCGPAQVGAASNVNYIEIWAASASNVQRTEKLRMWIDRDCSKYDTRVIYWLNKLGGIDMMNFPLVSRDVTEFNRKTYNRPVGLEQDDPSYDWVLNSYDTERAVFSTKTRKRMSLNTSFLNDTQAIYLEGLIGSPAIWWYDEDNSEFVRMLCERSDYETKKQINDGLFNEEIVLYESLENVRQRS